MTQDELTLAIFNLVQPEMEEFTPTEKASINIMMPFWVSLIYHIKGEKL